MPPRSSHCMLPSTHRHHSPPPSPANPAKSLPRGFSLSCRSPSLFSLEFLSPSDSQCRRVHSRRTTSSYRRTYPPTVPSLSTEALPLSHRRSALPLTDLTQAPIPTMRRLPPRHSTAKTATHCISESRDFQNRGLWCPKLLSFPQFDSVVKKRN